MCRKTKAGLKDELLEEFPETLSDELNLQPGEPMHIHLQDGARPRKTTVPRQVAKRFENAANTTLNELIARGVLVKEPGVTEWCSPAVWVPKGDNVRVRLCTEEETRKLTVDGAHRTAWKALRNLFDAERAPPWSISSLMPEATQEELGEKLADHFASISSDYSPLSGEQPTTYDNPHIPLTVQQISHRLAGMKKPASAVSIDPLAKCMDSYTKPPAGVLTGIINEIMAEGAWPKVWKREEVSVIPKGGTATTMDECRNITCTSIFSKLAESFMFCLLYTSPSPRDRQKSRMPSSA